MEFVFLDARTLSGSKGMATLNQLGDLGWELVSSTPVDAGNGPYAVHAIFKRPKLSN
jgi:hypothetical protein